MESNELFMSVLRLIYLRLEKIAFSIFIGDSSVCCLRTLDMGSTIISEAGACKKVSLARLEGIAVHDFNGENRISLKTIPWRCGRHVMRCSSSNFRCRPLADPQENFNEATLLADTGRWRFYENTVGLNFRVRCGAIPEPECDRGGYR
jgi:hypothetical protein